MDGSLQESFFSILKLLLPFFARKKKFFLFSNEKRKTGKVKLAARKKLLN
jgi:hypothetical protein